MRSLTASALILAAFVALLNAAEKKPNIVFILTDDQDYEMQSLEYMPLVQKHLIQEGTSFNQHYCTVAICCPSRVNLWTGRAAHNTNVTDLNPPYGGYPKFVQEGLNNDWLPVWLQELGYNTYYTGKLFNSHSITNYDKPKVNGFNGSDFLLDPYTYEFFNATMTRNEAEPVSYEGQYSPDVVAEKAYGFLDEAASDPERPFLLGIAPIAPHSNMRLAPPIARDMPFYAERHGRLFQDYRIPRTPHLNPDRPSGIGWVKKLPKLNDTVMEYHDEFARARLRSLQSVDEMIEEIIEMLDAKGLLENTYIFYSSDNGYHVGQHRLPPGKECAFEEDIHVPLIVRGPGVPKGHIAGVVSSHTDLSPTILKLADNERLDLDGMPLPLSVTELHAPSSGEHVNVEFWGAAIPEGQYGWIGNWTWAGLGPLAVRNNTYKALRLIGMGTVCCMWCTAPGRRNIMTSTYAGVVPDRFLMLTAVQKDPHQQQNLLDDELVKLADKYELVGRPLPHVLHRVDALLLVTKSCKAESCRSPWRSLHLSGHIKTLAQALDACFDEFYEMQPQVSFTSCQMGYIRSEEGPQSAHALGMQSEHAVLTPDGQQVLKYGHWSWWT